MAAKARAAAKAAISKKSGGATGAGGGAKGDGATTAAAGGATKSTGDDVKALPLKDQKTFKEILNLYETKQYRKGLKHCDALLKKFPEHGETLAMQGLFHHSLHDRQLGYDLVKKGVRASLRSHIVWHVYGIMTRADRNYEEALKCYSQAHRLDPDNIHILRDLSLLQVQLRHYQSYLGSRHRYLRANWKTRQQWLGLAVAYHLASQPSDALDVLLALESSQTDIADAKCFEISESILFTAHVAASIPGKEGWALDFLEERSGRVTDRTAFMLTRARLLARLERTEAAEWAWTALLDLNSDCLDYIQGYLELKGLSLPPSSFSFRRRRPSSHPSSTALTSEQRSSTLNVLQSLRSRYPSSSLLPRLVLEVAPPGDLFRAEAETYLRTGIRRGVPSLFNDLKLLCVDDAAKAATIGDIVASFRTTLESGGVLDSPSKDDEDEEAPSSYLWTLYFLAQLASSRGEHAAALGLVARALAHTPTLPDALVVQARLHKRAGSASLASASLSAARALDGQDRFLNGKAAKYLLRTDDIERAREVVGLFTRKEAPDPAADLVDMQALWFVLEEGEAWMRKGRLAMALKRFHQVADVFATWVDDQFDFHTYCVRKNTLRVYLDLLAMEDGIFAHPQYLRAAKSAIAIYISLHLAKTSPAAPAQPNGIAAQVNGAAPNGAESEAKPEEKAGESKKAAKKAKQAEAKAKAAAAADAKKAADTKDKDAEGTGLPPDDDPDGEKLAATTEPLESALTFWRPLGQMAKHEVDTWLLAFEIELARDKPLLALRAFKHARQLVADDDARLHVPLARLFSALSSPSLADPVKTALQAEVSELTPHKSLSDANDAYLAAHPRSAAHVLAVMESLVIMKTGQDALGELALSKLLGAEGVRWQDASQGLVLIKQASDSVLEERFRSKVAERWPLAEPFWTADDKAARLKGAGQAEREVVDP